MPTVSGKHALAPSRYRELQHEPTRPPPPHPFARQPGTAPLLSGDTDPVPLERPEVDPDLEVPRKCLTCRHLRPDAVHGVVCTKDAEVWGHLWRSLDWGFRAPDILVPCAPSLQLTLRFVRLAATGDDIGALREFRASNPNTPLAIGKALCTEVRATIQQHGDS